MAFDTAVEKYSGHTANQSGDNNNSSRGVTRVFTVVSNDPANDTCLGAKVADGVPRWREAHPVDSFLRATDINAQRMSPTLFEVTATYEAPSGEDEQNPLDKPAVYKFSSTATEEDIDQDVDGIIISTAAGEMFDPSLRDTVYDLQVSVTKNLASFDPLFAADYVNTINDGPFDLYNATWKKGEVCITEFSGEEVIDEDFSYFVQTITFVCRVSRDTDVVPQDKVWFKRVCNQGMYCIEGTKYVRARVNGHYAVKPVYLKTDGKILPREDEPNWLYFQTKYYQDFTQIQGLT